MGRCFTVNPGRGSNSARPPRPLTDRGGRSRRPQGTLRPKGVSMPDTPITLVVAERSGSATTSSGFCAARGDDARVRAIVRRSPERPIPRRRDRRTRDLTSCTAGSRSRSAPVHVSGMESELLRHLAAEPTRVLTAASCCARGGASRPEATHALSTPRLPAAQEAGAGRGAAPGRQRSGRPLPAVGGVRPERAGGGQGRSSDGHGRRSAFSGLVELASDPRSVSRRRRCLRCGGSGGAAADAPVSAQAQP
jgi:hypothetical protein